MAKRRRRGRRLDERLAELAARPMDDDVSGEMREYIAEVKARRAKARADLAGQPVVDLAKWRRNT